MSRLHCRRRTCLLALLEVVLAAGLAGAAAAAPGDRLTGYGDLRFGMSVADAAAAVDPARPAAEEGGIELIETPIKLAGLPALRRLLFVDDRLTSIVFLWELVGDAAGDAAARCRALFDRFHGQLAGRYGAPALGPHPSPESEPAFAGTSFWSFADAASISLVVVRDAGENDPCRATLNYKEPPAD